MSRPAALLALAALAGCPKPPPPEPVREIPDDVPKPRTDGKVAGPHYVVDEALPPPVPADVPGQGVLPAYVSALRRQIDERMAACTTAPSGGDAMAHLVVDPAGTVVAKELRRSSGDAAWDACLATALTAALQPPPPAILQEDGRYSVDLVFR